MTRRLVAAIAALAAGVAAVTLVVQLLRTTQGPMPTAAAPAVIHGPPTATTTPSRIVPPGFSKPPPGAVVFSRQVHANVLALAVRGPDRRALRLQASVLGPQGRGRTGLAVSFAAALRSIRAYPCGPGCYRATLRTRTPPSVVVVHVRGGTATTRWRVALPAVWPAAPAETLLAGAGLTWRRLRSLAYRERLASDAQHVINTDWRVEAPDRAAYVVAGGSAGVVIGRRRWDKAVGGRWIESAQSSPIHQPTPFWVSAVDAHVLRQAVVDGRSTWVVSFFDPDSLAWFQVDLEQSTLRTVRLTMNATAHFMHEVYYAFDRAAPITPPT